ncbi:hypothetical protein Asphe3_41340 (plasmid) [Pseudarthrobacter phenanthrenivorans Sphe3]|uniref:Uncharacterized protein n=1 Tax=Pseudarthrobacter phenanthrenivorans (strain DSM 18606 / JCM 16027 / LMG 23796 / Sphe3) TaxID=930171 RepID=F0MCE8_PSEPM|nr:hypothetical protein [Pseudarthrobacter phenanthrenivorans]ADX75199.1 hypothetical protein Asphe3_41340 [Pseudarthrobacter phenanthrenivorans Sphe3]
MVRQRGRTDPQTEKQIEAFAAQAEQPLAPVTALPQPAEPSAYEVEKSSTSKTPVPKATDSPSPRARILAPAMEAWKQRNREPKTGGINFRASTSQLELLRTAALVEEMSQQKILERLVWPILEEKYGSSLSE